MAVDTQARITYDDGAIREGLSDKIALVSPSTTPFWSNIRRDRTLRSVHPEWQTQALAAAAANAQLEGDTLTNSAPSTTTRVGNYAQISRKVAEVTLTEEAVNRAGRQGEMNFQVATKIAELKTDIEFTMLSNVASVAGTSTVARKCGGIQTWLTSNTVLGTGTLAAVGGYVATTGLTSARTAGTTTTFVEANVRTIMASLFANGATGVNQVYVDGTLKQTFSTFSGISAIRNDAGNSGQARIVAAADAYQSDFGQLVIIPNPMMQTGNTASTCAFFIDPNMVGYAPLRDFQTFNLAKTADSERKAVVTEWSMIMDNEKAHGMIADRG